ncbi:MAG: hypothetical protein QG589_345 [Patescibacteria group bacterium]|nr:hypothetical protein [Patescibacteria group bacterium]
MCPRPESNWDRKFRKLAFYPLNYEDKALFYADTNYHIIIKNQNILAIFQGEVRYGIPLSNALQAYFLFHQGQHFQ